MSEHIQNQNVLTEEEMRARDDAIFDTVAEFRNEMDNPAAPEQSAAKTPEEFDTRMDALEAKMTAAEQKMQDAQSQPDMYDALKQKALANREGATGRRRKAYDVDKDIAGLKEDQFSSITARKHRGTPYAHKEAVGIAAHYTGESGKKGSESSSNSTEEHGYQGNLYVPLELQEGDDPVISVAATEAAEEAARKMPRMEQAGIPLGTTEASEPVAAPSEPEAQTGGRHRAPKGRRTPRIMADGQVGAGYTGSVRVASTEAATNNSAGEDDGPVIGADGRLHTSGEATPVLVTPEARRRDRIVARLGRMGIDVEGIRSEFSAAGNEIKDSWRQLMQARANRRAASSGDTREKFWDRHGSKITLAAAGIGMTAVAAGLGIQHNVASEDIPASASASATPHASESAKPFGPQASASTPEATPTHKVTPKPSATTKTPSVGPSALPTTPNFVPSPTEQHTTGSATGEQQQTKETDHDSISFTTKDGKVVRATATLKAGGSIFEAGHDAGLTATEVANAVNKAGITNQQAEQLPVGQQMNFDRQADGSYVVHLQR
ncbi:MAG TPA: hypothetical protein VJ843_05390 [Candidatus Saccharimonadales bacterium]|nr:hypothetical protein [Candidatus Saccharimonadales bacterium]